MARYDYECKKCNAIWDVSVPLKDLDKELKCPTCDEKLTRNMPAPYFKVN